MEKDVKIICSPSTSSLEVAGNIVLKLHVPYSESSVTIQVNPNIQDYQENADTDGAQVRQLMMSTATDQTTNLTFDFETNRIHQIEIDNEKYIIELTNIGKEEIDGGKFPTFEFKVTTG